VWWLQIAHLITRSKRGEEGLKGLLTLQGHIPNDLKASHKALEEEGERSENAHMCALSPAMHCVRTVSKKVITKCRSLTLDL
jgi:hypothetical protein